MNARTLLNLLLLAGVLALGAVAWFQPGVEKEATEGATLTSLRPAQVARVRIERADAEHLSFERRDGRWWMVDPIEAPAGSVRMDGVLRIAEAGSLRQYPAREVDLVQVGLEQPEVTLFFDDHPPIAFGDTEPLTGARYLRVGGTVHLVEDTGYYHVIGGYTTFLDSALLPGDAVIEGLTLPGLKLARKEERWVVEPQPEKFSVDQVNTLLDEWRHVQSLDVRRYDGGKVRDEVLVKLRDRGEPVRFAIVGRSPELILARPEWGVEYRFPGETAKRLFALPPFPEAKQQPNQQSNQQPNTETQR